MITLLSFSSPLSSLCRPRPTGGSGPCHPIDEATFRPDADASLTGENTNRDERSTELYFNSSHNWTTDFTTWSGVRYTRLNRSSVRTDGSRATDYEQDLTTRFVAASYQINPAHMVYASFGQGVENDDVLA